MKRVNTQDKDLDSFGPRETSSGNCPTCCLRLGLIMLMRESPVNRLFVFSPIDCFFLLVPLWGALPLLIYVEGAGYMWSPIRIRTSLSLIQTRYKSRSQLLVKQIFLTPFLLNRPTITWACWKYALEAIINRLLLYFLVHDNRLLSMLELYW